MQRLLQATASAACALSTAAWNNLRGYSSPGIGLPRGFALQTSVSQVGSGC